MAVFEGSIFSRQLRMYTSLRVIIPQTGERDKKILYLLHGLCDDSSLWLRRTRIEAYALEHDYVVFMPEVQRSFYMDIVHGGNYFTYVSTELPQLCEQLFGIRHTKEKTFIAGSSMGGYGALKCALRNPGQYAACAAFSGVLNINARADEPEKEKVFPESVIVFGENGTLGDNDDVFALARQTATLSDGEKPEILLTCGVEDIYRPDSAGFHKHLDSIFYGKHAFMEWKGGHDWTFWDESIKKTLSFFDGATSTKH